VITRYRRVWTPPSGLDRTSGRVGEEMSRMISSTTGVPASDCVSTRTTAIRQR
jgi:hypothetical protein